MKEDLIHALDNQKDAIVAEPLLMPLQRQFTFDKIPFPTHKQVKFKFIDLFAGIGGFRIAFQNLGGQCVFTSEIDKYAQKTY